MNQRWRLSHNLSVNRVVQFRRYITNVIHMDVVIVWCIHISLEVFLNSLLWSSASFLLSTYYLRAYMLPLHTQSLNYTCNSVSPIRSDSKIHSLHPFEALWNLSYIVVESWMPIHLHLLWCHQWHTLTEELVVNFIWCHPPLEPCATPPPWCLTVGSATIIGMTLIAWHNIS